jgi:hypothetical protein
MFEHELNTAAVSVCLCVACRWLRPYPTGALPLLQIRTTLLDLLQLMNLDTSDMYVRDKLADSELGKILMFYSQNDLEKSSKCMPPFWLCVRPAVCAGGHSHEC